MSSTYLTGEELEALVEIVRAAIARAKADECATCHHPSSSHPSTARIAGGPCRVTHPEQCHCQMYRPAP